MCLLILPKFPTEQSHELIAVVWFEKCVFTMFFWSCAHCRATIFVTHFRQPFCLSCVILRRGSWLWWDMPTLLHWSLGIAIHESRTGKYRAIRTARRNKKNSERPVDALALKISMTHLLTTWNQEMLAHLKNNCNDLPLPEGCSANRFLVSRGSRPCWWFSN